MKLLVYTSIYESLWGSLIEAVEEAVPRGSIEVFRRVEDLRRKLRGPLVRPAVVVFVAGTRLEMETLAGMQPLLHDVRTILLVPDESPATLKMAHALGPSYLTTLDRSLADLTAVLRRLFPETRQQPAEATRQGMDAAGGDPERREYSEAL